MLNVKISVKWIAKQIRVLNRKLKQMKVPVEVAPNAVVCCVVDGEPKKGVVDVCEPNKPVLVVAPTPNPVAGAVLLAVNAAG